MLFWDNRSEDTTTTQSGRERNQEIETSMAETVVWLVIEKLIGFLGEEVKFPGVGSLRRQFKYIKDELESMCSFLRDADARADKEGPNQQGSVHVWVKQVREVAFQMEDLMDKYMLHVAQHGHGNGGNGFTAHIKKTAFFLKNARWRRRIADEVQQIKASLAQIKERSDKYKFSSAVSDSPDAWSDPRVASRFVSAADVVGFEDAKLELIGLLQQGPAERKVISVVGMGGLGKTTLVKIVSDSNTVKHHFECFAWVTVSQSYKKEALLRSLIMQFSQSKQSAPGGEAIGTMEEHVRLVTKLRQDLQGKRYVVVFDDVWNVNFWADIEYALPDDNIGNRIIITTRNVEVATFCKRSSSVHIHQLQPLSLDLAWELFCMKAFKFEFGGSCPEALRSLSVDIVQKCGGLPLAVEAVGGLLCTKNKTMSEWQKLHGRLQSELECNPHLTNIMKILSLSYHDLPPHLKSCFLYFGIFPEDYKITGSRLIQLWIAEGFIEASKDSTPEQVGYGYLIELLQRNMIQISRDYGGADKLYGVHDLMRETILSLAGKLNFCQASDDLDKETRRLSVCSNFAGNNIFHSERSLPVRSLFIFGVDKLHNSFMDKLFECFKLLKVLDLEDAPLDHLPQNVGNLVHLRYLSVRNTNISRLPKSIGRLLNLQTLNVQQTLLQELPVESYRLDKLRHLLCGYDNSANEYSLQSRRGMRIQNRIGDLQDLQILDAVDVTNGVGIMEGLMKLKELRELRITNVTAKSLSALCAALEKMIHLEVLDLRSANESEILDLAALSNPPPFLWNLSLRGRLLNLPPWFSQLHKVATLRLFFSRLRDNPLKSLQALPSLTSLELYDAYSGEQLHIKEGEFPKLKMLDLKSIERLSTLTIEKGAMPVLEALTIGPSPNMKEVPAGIFHLKSLKRLRIRDMARPFVLRVMPEHGEDYWKVEHVQDVVCSYRIKGIRYETYKLGSSDLVERLQSS